jgi:phosphate transport system protein
VSVTAQEDVAGRRVADRVPLEQALREAEQRSLAELQIVRTALDRAVAAVTEGKPSLADEVAGQVAELTRRYEEVHEGLLTLMARQAPVAGDLRLAIALLHVNERVERMARQCGNIVTLHRALPEGQHPASEQLECLAAMARLADEQIAEAAMAFAARDVAGARRLDEHDLGINRANRRCFSIAVREGDRETAREVGFLVAMMARAIERIGDNAVDIGRQAAFVATGRLHGEREVPGILDEAQD